VFGDHRLFCIGPHHNSSLEPSSFVGDLDSPAFCNFFSNSFNLFTSEAIETPDESMGSYRYRQATYENDSIIFPITVVPDQELARNYAIQWADGSDEVGADAPFYVCNVSQFLKQHQQWLSLMPRVHPFYAVKCNPDPTLIQILSLLGCGFDCASKGELDLVLGQNIAPERIIYANPCKTASFIKHAKEVGANLMTFDNADELKKIKQLFPEARMVLRIFAMDPTALCPLSLKFGADPVTEAPGLLKLAAEMGIEVIGISFHVGSGCRDATAYRIALEHARRLFDLGLELGHSMGLLDLGGGFPGVDTAQISLEKIASLVNPLLDEMFPRESGVRIIAEPGRFYAHAAYTLVVKIIAKREAKKKNEEGIETDYKMYYVNDGVYGSFNCLVFDHATVEAQALPTKENRKDDDEDKDKEEGDEKKNINKTTLHWSCVWGPTCDSIDLILERCRLPDLEVGDWIIFENMGAYTRAAASPFNGFQPPAVQYIVSEADWSLLMTLNRKSEVHAIVDRQMSTKLNGDGNHAELDSGFVSDSGHSSEGDKGTDAILDELESIGSAPSDHDAIAVA